MTDRRSDHSDGTHLQLYVPIKSGSGTGTVRLEPGSNQNNRAALYGTVYRYPEGPRWAH